MTIILNGFDHIEVNGRLLSSLANDDAGKLTFPNEAMQMYKGGGAAVAFKADADIAELELHFFRATEDDQFMASQALYQKTNTFNFTPLTGMIVKFYSGSIQERVTLSDGFFTKIAPDLSTSFAGNADATQSVYTLRFATSERTYG